ncbi:pilus assembly protein [Arhodomonas aquaeolei]|uniref:pilus assembly protein n=1 Tax=Arhodomonas aquaeolei TaxID=2369 RepID=UPI0003A6D813|nr:PilC/PilY family type IV pilus protein [Arhodomonas aquaeolei]
MSHGSSVCRWGLVAGLLLSLLSIAHADDTEIYVPDESAWKQPNVLFVVDTSGSMSSTVEVTPEEYDASQSYDGDCDTGRIYWSEGGGTPSCGGRNGGTDNWITEDAFKCDSAQGSLDSAGQALGVRSAQNREQCSWSWSWSDGWHRECSTSWRDLDDNSHDAAVECRADRGTHGASDGDAAVYASDTDGPWSENEDEEINWGYRDDYNFYTGNYLNYLDSATVEEKTRLEVVQQIAGDLVDSINGINIGLMRFDAGHDCGYWSCSYSGGFVDLAIDDIGDNRSAFKTKLNSYYPGGNTPLSETYWEAARYFRGEGVVFGNETEPRTSVDECRQSDSWNTYKSPIEDPCQNNYVILLTDGLPTDDTEANDAIRDLTGASCSGNGGCLDELAEYLYEEDQFDDSDFGRDLSDFEESTQKIITYTIGFRVDDGLLSDTANKGGGRYYTVDTYDELKSALTEIFVEIVSSGATFASPGVAVDNFNRLQNRNELYYALFEPASTTRWPGNVKKYRLGYDEDTDTFQVEDANHTAAVDSSTGFFKDNAKSYWSEVVDGDDVQKGGAANQYPDLNPESRNVYTYLGDSENLTASSNALDEGNSGITKSMIGLADSASDAERTEVLKWARGVDVLDSDDDGSTSDACQRMGDPLHGQPVLVTYGGSQDSPDITLYAITNSGYLHAIDTSDGSETFAYVPSDLLGNLATLMDNPDGTDKTYGLDGPLETYVEENGDDSDQTIEAGEGDKAYVFAGMRRGGRDFHALDVTDRSEPSHLWTITGGSGEFSELGQTWSAPQTATLLWTDGSEKDVLIFGGGYDPAQDVEGAPVTDGQGRAIYIVDMETGELLWWAGPSDSGADLELSNMTNSIPADVTVVDIDADGYPDALFAADMAGQIWRLDFTYKDTDSGEQDGDPGIDALDEITGGRIADFAGSGEAGNRRFYNAPDVTLINNGGENYLAVSIGSGYRAHPLDTTINERFYMLKSTPVYGAPTGNDGNVDYTTVTESDLYDATDNTIGQGSDEDSAAAQETLDEGDGWYIDLEADGEKVLGTATVFNSRLLFTTFIPSDDPEAVCGTRNGHSRLYLMDVRDATPVANLDTDSDDLTDTDRYVSLTRGGIAPSPQVLLVPGGENGDGPIQPVVTVGTELPLENFCKEDGNCVDGGPLGSLPALSRTYWRENETE